MTRVTAHGRDVHKTATHNCTKKEKKHQFYNVTATKKHKRTHTVTHANKNKSLATEDVVLYTINAFTVVENSIDINLSRRQVCSSANCWRFSVLMNNISKSKQKIKKKSHPSNNARMNKDFSKWSCFGVLPPATIYTICWH